MFSRLSDMLRKKNKDTNYVISNSLNTFSDVKNSTELLPRVDKTFTFKNIEQTLKEQFGIVWSEYYTPHRKSSNNFEFLRFKDKYTIRDYLTCYLNQIYINHCYQNKKNPNNLISLPEHMINNFDLLNDKESICKEMNWIINRYIDKDGTMYSTCYAKQIKSAYNDILNIKGKDKTQNFNVFSELLPDYSKEEKFKFRYINSELPPNLYNDLLDRIKVAEDIVSMVIPPKYRLNTGITIESSGITPHVSLKNLDIILPLDAPIDCIVHEYIHTILLDYNNKEVMLAANDFMYELIKGREILSLNSIDSKYGPDEKFKSSGIKNLDPYATKLPFKNEYYSPKNEILSVLVGDYLTEDITLIDNKVFDKQTGQVSTIKKIIDRKFNQMCTEYPYEIGAFVLSFLKGDYKA